MHVGKGGWAGQAFALATSNDSRERKSRIRRSKEERKSMVESFIKKYQKSNNGNFPSLNLTHKEVGGSFYTVREIVREIIQENRVLAPPKISLEENGHSVFLEQHPLGSIAMEPQIDLPASDRVHMVTHIMPNKYEISSEESISCSSGSSPLELDNEQIVNGSSKLADKDEGSDRASHHAPNQYQDTSIEEVSSSEVQSTQPKSHEFEDGKTVNGFEVLDRTPDLDKPLVTNIDQDNIGVALLSGEKFNEPGSQRLSDEHHKKNDQPVDKTKEFVQRIYTEPAVMETLDQEKTGAKNEETSQAIKSHINSDVVVETFPLRPVPRTIHNMDGESGELQEAAGTLEDKAIQHDKKTLTQSSTCSVDKKVEKLPDSTVELNGEYRDEKLVINLQGSSLENATSEPNVLVKEVESKVSSPDATKASSYIETQISKDSAVVGKKSSDQDRSSSPKGNTPTLDRINLKTWEASSKKSSQPESNPLLALVKAFISSFVKFWTE